MIRSFRVSAFVFALALAASFNGPVERAAAQEVHRAAAVVNDEIISLFDLVMRTRLAVLAAGLSDPQNQYDRLQQQVLRGLVDERLKMQEAQRLEIAITEQQLGEAIRRLANQNKMSGPDFQQYLVRNNVAPQALADQVRTTLTWQSVIQRRLRPTVDISDEEVEEVVDRLLTSQGGMELRISEIFLGVDSVNQENEVERGARRLIQEIRNGADFRALAQQFSRAATAAVGGDLGWLEESQLPDEFRNALSGARPGTLVGPVQTFGGYYILLLRDLRRIATGNPTVQLKQLLVGVPSGAGADEWEAARLKAEESIALIDGCIGFDAFAKENGSPGSGDLGRIKLADLSPMLRRTITGLEIGEPSDPVKLPSGISVLLVCDRENDGIDREKIRESLVAQRLDLLSRRYLRDLRRAANVDMRL
ncbi:MAG: peptidylprolyl isomerase [Kiloniellales bacterium]|nr:peptidylprolyl isomerase [Kiloniellales bacterium]